MGTMKFNFYCLLNAFVVYKQSKRRKIHIMGTATTITTSSIDLPHDLNTWIGFGLTLTLTLSLTLASSIDIPYVIPTWVWLGLTLTLSLILTLTSIEIPHDLPT